MLIGLAKYLFDRGRRSIARGFFTLASYILRSSVTLYGQSSDPSIVLRIALLAVKVLERSALMTLFGFKMHPGDRDKDSER
jgi:hypothetical protein